MPFQQPILPGEPSRRQLQRGLDNVTLSHRAGAGLIAAKTGNHYQIKAIRQIKPRGGTSLIPVRLTAYINTSSAKNYTGVLRTPNGSGGYSDVSPTVTYTGQIFEKRGFVGVELGGTVFIQAAGVWSGSGSVLTAGTAVYEFTFVEPRQIFAVKVYKTGGSAGPVSTWVYTAKSPDGDVLGTGLTPEMRRPSGTATTAPSDGTTGTGYWTAAGVFVLLDANESC